jgi:hypothetical protein
LLLSRERAKFSPAWGKVKIAAGIAKAMSWPIFDLTTPPEEIAAVRSKNEFFEVPIAICKGDGVPRITAQKADNSYSGSDYGSCFLLEILSRLIFLK